MTPIEFNKLTSIEQLRTITKAFSNCNESFLDQFTVPQLFKIYTAWITSSWTFYPDQWSERQVKEALRGIIPNWNPITEKPIHTRQATS